MPPTLPPLPAAPPPQPALDDSDHGLEAFGGSIEKSEAARISFEQKRIESQERMYRDLLAERARQLVECRMEEERRDRRDMGRMQTFMEFYMKVVVTAVKEATKMDE